MANKILDSVEGFFQNFAVLKKVKTAIFGESKVVLETIVKASKGKTYVILRENDSYEINRINTISYKALNEQKGFKITVRMQFLSADFSDIDPGVNPVLTNPSFEKSIIVTENSILQYLEEMKDGAEPYLIESFLQNYFSFREVKSISVYELSDAEMGQIFKFHNKVNPEMQKLLNDTFMNFRKEHMKKLNSNVLKGMGIEIN